MQFSAKLLIHLSVCLLITTCSSVSSFQRPTDSTKEPSTDVLWSTDHESGTLATWYAPETGPVGSFGGGEFDSVGGKAEVSTEQAHSGSWSVKMQITPGNSASGTRLFRWKEPHSYAELRYSAWYYFPRAYRVAGWWSILQWKSKRSDKQNDPFFMVDVGNRNDGSMYLFVYDWQHRRAYSQNHMTIPLQRWFQLEAEYRCSDDKTGHLTLWQDGNKLAEIGQTETRYSEGDCEWSVNNYGQGVTPEPVIIYVDDAEIRKPSH